MHVSVVGLGRLGLAFAASVANAGVQVSGIDIDSQRVAAVNDQVAPSQEPKLSEYMTNAGNRLQATTDPTESIPDSEISFIFVNTYTDDEGYSLEAVESATRSVGKSLSAADSPHLVVLRCTVLPGNTESQVVEWLEAESGLVVGEDILLCYWPEFTALGSLIDSMEAPNYRLIGKHTEAAGDRLQAFIEQWSAGPARTVRMNLRSAEVAKMAINTYVATKLSFVNHLGRVCEGVDANVDAVTEVMAEDPRISGHYFNPGVRYGGPCFPHDNIAFERLASDAGVAAPLAQAADEVNNTHTEWIGDVVRGVSDSDATVAVLGLTYKPGVPVIQESQGVELVNHLRGEFDVVAVDPIAATEATERFESAGVTVLSDVSEVVRNANVAVLTLQDDQLVDPSVYENLTLIDPWRAFDADDLALSVTYHPLGRPK